MHHAVALLWLSACYDGPPRFSLLAVEPSAIENADNSVIVLVGRDFHPVTQRYNLDSPEHSQRDDRFRVFLLPSGSRRIALDEVNRESDSRITARVPAGLTPQTYGIELTGPSGASATLEGALTVVVPSVTVECQVPADCPSDPCVPTPRCELGQCVGERVPLTGVLDTCDAVDNDCDGATDEDPELVWYADADGDGYIDPLSAQLACADPDGAGSVWGPNTTIADCADNPGSDPNCGGLDGANCTPESSAPDLCDGIDTDCDGATDEDPELVWYADADGDGFGDPLVSANACTAPMDFVSDATDCDDDPFECGINCNTAEPESTAALNCSDGFDNDCDGSLDASDSGCGATNIPPLAVAAISPGAGLTTTAFQGDATGTSDVEQTAGTLSYAWDWGDGSAIDTNQVPAPHFYAAAGGYQVQLTVTDDSGASSIAAFDVSVSDVSALDTDFLVVNDSGDVDDGTNPGEPGFTLREAVRYANGRIGHQTIFVPPGTTVMMEGGLFLTNDDGVEIVADGAVLDGSGPGADSICIQVASNRNRIVGLTIRGCISYPVLVNAAHGNEILRGTFVNNGGTVYIDGTDNVFGPGNTISLVPGNALRIEGGIGTFWGNRIFDASGEGIIVGGGGAGSRVYSNTVFRCGSGIVLAANADDTVVINNTLHSNAVGYSQPASVSGTDLRNNILTDNSLGLQLSGSFAVRDFNAFDGNNDTCGGCVLGPNSIEAAPFYVDAVVGDLRLRPESLYVGAGDPTVIADWALDLNGPAAGTVTGATDLGAWDAPY